MSFTIKTIAALCGEGNTTGIVEFGKPWLVGQLQPACFYK